MQLCRCRAGDEPQQGRLKRFFRWGRRVLESLTADTEPEKPDKISQASSGTRDTEGIQKPSPTPAQGADDQPGTTQPVPEASSPAVSPAVPEQRQELDAVDVIEEEDKSIDKAQPKAKQRELSLSTVKLYDQASSDEKLSRTRSSIGREGVIVNARAKIASPREQKAYFDKIIGSVAKKEQAENRLRRRKKQYIHLSRQGNEITQDWPSAEEPNWEQWKRVAFFS